MCYSTPLPSSIVILIHSNIIGIGMISLLFGLLSAESAYAYFPADFEHLKTGNPLSVRRSPSYSRSAYSSISTGFRSQRGRTRPQSLRTYSTDSYVSAQQKRREASRTNWLGSRTNQVMEVCTEKFPESSLRCFSRNHRLTQRQDVPINHNTVR